MYNVPIPAEIQLYNNLEGIPEAQERIVGYLHDPVFNNAKRFIYEEIRREARYNMFLDWFNQFGLPIVDYALRRAKQLGKQNPAFKRGNAALTEIRRECETKAIAAQRRVRAEERAFRERYRGNTPYQRQRRAAAQRRRDERPPTRDQRLYDVWTRRSQAIRLMLINQNVEGSREYIRLFANSN